MGKCEGRDFDAQIVYLTLYMLTYNSLSMLKRFKSYETLEGISRGLQTEAAELTLYERICLFIKDFSETLYQYFSIFRLRDFGNSFLLRIRYIVIC